MQYALLMRANKPETAVQSSALFLLAPHGLPTMHLAKNKPLCRIGGKGRGGGGGGGGWRSLKEEW